LFDESTLTPCKCVHVKQSQTLPKYAKIPHAVEVILAGQCWCKIRV